MSPPDKGIEFVVFAPPYDPDKGGFIALHYLCHLLNELGHPAYLIPYFNSAEVSPVDEDDLPRQIFRAREQIRAEPYRLHTGWNTPIYRKPWRGIRNRNDIVVVYPEITFGNPLRARNVARWILHEPGFHKKEVYFAPGEVHFRYLEMHRAVPMPWIEIAEQLLTVTYVPWEHYQPPPAGHRREGTAYLLRKGAGRPVVHALDGSILVDGMSHAQMGEVMRQVETFISYDSRTFYSLLAALAGADSVVIPDEGVSRSEWQPDETLHAGIAYGFDDLERARATRPQLPERLKRWSNESIASASDFAAFWTKRLNEPEGGRPMRARLPA
jgi:hypothetical protein